MGLGLASEPLADLDFGVGNECVGRHRQVARRGSLTDAARSVVDRTVAGAEEAVVSALMGDRDTAEMGADADHDQPLIMPRLDALLVALRIGQARYRHLAGLVDLLLGPMADVDRLAAPEHLDVLSLGDRGQVDLNRRTGRDRRGIRVHLGNQRPHRGSGAYGGDGSRCNKKEITACRMVRRRRCRHDSKPFLICSQQNRPGGAKKRDPEEAAGARGPRSGRKNRFSSPNPAEQAVQNRSIGTLAVRAQARYRLASVQCTKSASDRDLFNTFQPDISAGPRALAHCMTDLASAWESPVIQLFS